MISSNTPSLQNSRNESAIEETNMNKDNLQDR